MSWHAGDWANFSISCFSAVAALSSAFSAKISKKAAESIERERREQRCIDLLASEAMRMYECIGTQRICDVKIEQKSNICRAICNGKHLIITYKSDDESEKRLKLFFINKLPYQATKSINEKKPSIHKKSDLNFDLEDWKLRIETDEAIQYFTS